MSTEDQSIEQNTMTDNYSNCVELLKVEEDSNNHNLSDITDVINMSNIPKFKKRSCCLTRFIRNILILVFVLAFILFITLYIFSTQDMYYSSWNSDMCHKSVNCTDIKNRWIVKNKVDNIDDKMMAIINGNKRYNIDGHEVVILKTVIWYIATVVCCIIVLKVIKRKACDWFMSLF